MTPFIAKLIERGCVTVKADSSLEEIGHDESSRSSSCMSLPAHEIDEFSPVFIEEDDDAAIFPAIFADTALLGSFLNTY